MKDGRFVFALLIAVSCVLTTMAKAEEEFEAKTFMSPDGTSLKYRIHIPEIMDAGTHCPVVLFLHGAGERGDDNNRQLVHGVKPILAYAKRNNQSAIIIAPQCPNGQQWVNVPWGAASHTMPKDVSRSLRLATELLDETVSTLPVDKKRVYVTGLSMGGFGAWDMIQRMPSRFAAAIPVCGGGDTNLAAVIKDVPIWAFHGGSDGAVKTQRSRDMIAAIQKAGGKPVYTEYEGVGHNSWSRTYADEKVLKWLFDQSK